MPFHKRKVKIMEMLILTKFGLNRRVLLISIVKNKDMKLKTILPIFALFILCLGCILVSQPSEKCRRKTSGMEVKGAFRNNCHPLPANLAAKRSIKIQAPQGMRAAGIYETTSVPVCGRRTVVEKGVCGFSGQDGAGGKKMTNVQTEGGKIQTQLEQARIDTVSKCRYRDELANPGVCQKKTPQVETE